MRTIVVHSRDQPWITPKIKQLIKQRQKLFSKKDPAWNTLRNRILRMIPIAKSKFHHGRVQSEKSSNPAKWYRHIRVMTNTGNSQPCIRPPAGVDQHDSQAVADCINDLFVSVTENVTPSQVSPHTG